MPKVSVIVPIYNVEKYIERCAVSLFEQTLDDIEYIFVDDCTPDNSISILESVLKEFPNRIHQVKIIPHKKNQGQAGARTTGMKAMTGEYMIHCDPDDWVEPDMYELMYNQAIKTNADIITCAYILEDDSKQIINVEPDNTTQESLLNITFSSRLFDKLIRSSIINDYQIYPYNGINSGEDLNIIIRSYFYAKYIYNICNPLYHYNNLNPNAITKKSPKIRIEKYTRKNLELLSNFLQLKSGNKYDHVINFYKWRAKYELLENPHRDLWYWSKLWPECHKDIHKYGLPFKQRIIFQLFSNYPHILNIYFKYLDWRTK